MLEVFGALPAEIDAVSPPQSLRDVVSSARQHRLTYDAVYLELARRRGLPLATLDSRLAAACRSVGVGVLR